MAEEKVLTTEEKRQEIINLTSQLSSNISDIGDWKISKIYEYRMLGKDDPYDFEALAAQRQDVRDKINALQTEIDEAEA